MRKNPNTLSWKERWKSVSKTFVAYKKDSIASIDEAKKNDAYLRRWFLQRCCISAVYFLSALIIAVLIII